MDILQKRQFDRESELRSDTDEWLTALQKAREDEERKDETAYWMYRREADVLLFKLNIRRQCR